MVQDTVRLYYKSRGFRGRLTVLTLPLWKLLMPAHGAVLKVCARQTACGLCKGGRGGLLRRRGVDRCVRGCVAASAAPRVRAPPACSSAAQRLPPVPSFPLVTVSGPGSALLERHLCTDLQPPAPSPVSHLRGRACSPGGHDFTIFGDPRDAQPRRASASPVGVGHCSAACPP